MNWVAFVHLHIGKICTCPDFKLVDNLYGVQKRLFGSHPPLHHNPAVVHMIGFVCCLFGHV